MMHRRQSLKIIMDCRVKPGNDDAETDFEPANQMARDVFSGLARGRFNV
jgi:hypothetical protein